VEAASLFIGTNNGTKISISVSAKIDHL